MDPRWTEDRLIAKNSKLKSKIAQLPNNLLIRACENELMQSRRQLAGLYRQSRDDRIFFKNRFKSLKKERHVARKQRIRQEQDLKDIRLIKDEIHTQK